MGFVHDNQEFLWITVELSCACGKEIEQTVRPFTGLTSIKMQGVILNGLAMPNFSQHLQIILRTLFKAMSFNEFVLHVELC